MPKTDTTVDQGKCSTLVIPQHRHLSTSPGEDAFDAIHHGNAPIRAPNPRNHMKGKCITKHYEHIAKHQLMEDTCISLDLNITSRSLTTDIKIVGHGGRGKLKRVSLENLKYIRDKIDQLLKEFSWDDVYKLRNWKENTEENAAKIERAEGVLHPRPPQ